ncbi:MAG: 5'/3'-nucleotidase SurE [Actinomycetota bacterium]
MRLLVTNDDGIDARGLHVLVEAVTRLRGDHEVVVVAPDDEWSGAGAALGALFKIDPVVRRASVPGSDVEAWKVDGPPGLCVMFARLGAFGGPFDLVVSGINPGANVGRAVYHSGTIGAAVTGRNGLVPGVAFSQGVSGFSAIGQSWDELVADLSFDAASEIAHTVVQRLVDDLPDDPFVMNVNVPDRPLAQMQGWKHTVVGVEPPRAATTAELTPVQGEDDAFTVTMGWGDKLELDPETDAGAIEEGWVTVTNLSRMDHEPRPDLDRAAAALDGLFPPP